MTGRTHDLAAFTALNAAVILTPAIPDITLATAITAIGANMLGGLLPDIDNATSDFWDKFRGGNILARIVRPFVGKHRMISHSLLGMFIAGWLMKGFLAAVGTVLLVDMEIVWWAVMIGFASHLVTDAMTKQGIPLLFPLPWDFGIPPLEFLRMRTGGRRETWIVFPGLIIANILMFYYFYGRYLHLIRGFFS
jgi:inner membrane protein